jgi:hypothetical protein
MIVNDEVFFDKLKTKIINSIRGVEEEEEKKTENVNSIEVIAPQELTPDLFDAPEL